ncbi:MAG TPA: hypothetical protein VJP78_01550 [Thermoleophilia bacterium]|nr:hypothetical protein [Thermoleophilia bacterium]
MSRTRRASAAHASLRGMEKNGSGNGTDEAPGEEPLTEADHQVPLRTMAILGIQPNGEFYIKTGGDPEYGGKLGDMAQIHFFLGRNIERWARMFEQATAKAEAMKAQQVQAEEKKKNEPRILRPV